MATRKTAPVKGLEDYTFEKSEEYWPGRVIKQHGWTNTRTGDWATKFPTKAEAVKAAHRFEKGLRAEERGVVGTRQFRGRLTRVAALMRWSGSSKPNAMMRAPRSGATALA